MQIESNGMVKKYNYSEVGITDGLVGWWPLNGNANDFSGNSNHGTVSGATVASGLDSLCYSFDAASGNYISVIDTTGVLSTPTALSVSVWVYYISGNGRIVQKDDKGASTYTRCWEMGGMGGVFRMELWHSDGTNTVQSANALTINGWMHLCMTFDGVDIKIYQDALLAKTYNFPGNIRTNIVTPLTIGGQWSTSEWFNGKIDDVRIYNRALSADEVNILYELGNSTTKTKVSKNTTFVKGEFNELL